jgi:hypothetical protein
MVWRCFAASRSLSWPSHWSSIRAWKS